MSIMTLMIPMALLLGFGFLSAFVWATCGGQFDDLDTPSKRILMDDPMKPVQVPADERKFRDSK